MEWVQQTLEQGEVGSHLIQACADFEEALVLIARGARHVETALAAQPRDRKGRPVEARALELGGALHAATSATHRLKSAMGTCSRWLERDGG